MTVFAIVCRIFPYQIVQVYSVNELVVIVILNATYRLYVRRKIKPIGSLRIVE